MQSGPGRHKKAVAFATDLKGMPRPRRKIAAFRGCGLGGTEAQPSFGFIKPMRTWCALMKVS